MDVPQAGPKGNPFVKCQYLSQKLWFCFQGLKQKYDKIHQKVHILDIELKR